MTISQQPLVLWRRSWHQNLIHFVAYKFCMGHFCIRAKLKKWTAHWKLTLFDYLSDYIFFKIYKHHGWPLDHNSRIRVSSILMLVVQVLREFAVEEFFFLLALRKKAKDFYFSDELHTRSRTWKPLSSARAGLSPKIRGSWERKEDDQGRWSVSTRRGRKNKK